MKGVGVCNTGALFCQVSGLLLVAEGLGHGGRGDDFLRLVYKDRASQPYQNLLIGKVQRRQLAESEALKHGGIPTCTNSPLSYSYTLFVST